MDNCSHNGDKLAKAIYSYVEHWVHNGFVDPKFNDYVHNKNLVSFPWTMIDKITPRPDSSIEKVLIQDKIDNIQPIITPKKTYIAPFVNAEESEYLVIEDSFPNGRPALEKAGFIFTDRATVEKVEKMKVCTCLNPLHTALAIFGCLLGYQKIHEEMKDPQLFELIKKIGYKEGLPVVTNPQIINPKAFLDTVLQIRFPNPFMPDTPQRIATDTSQKLSVRYGETIKNYIKQNKDLHDLHMIPLVFAGWLRYLMGIDDFGNSFELSDDPLLDSLLSIIRKIHLKDRNVENILQPILENEQIFGVNLYQVGLAQKVCFYFQEMISDIGAIRLTLIKYTQLDD